MSSNQPPSAKIACESAPTTTDDESGMTWKAQCEACHTNETSGDDRQACMDNLMEKYAKWEASQK